MSENILQDYTVLITILMTLFISRTKLIMHTNIVTAWIANFTGTFFHELAHLVFSIVLNGKPVKVSLLPEKTENGYALGYVLNSNITWYNALPIALAPLTLLMAVYYIYSYFFEYMEFTVTNYIIYLFLLVSFLDSAIPSIQDFKVAFSNFGFLVYFALFGAWLYCTWNGCFPELYLFN